MSNYPDLTFLTGVQITTNLNQEPSTRNVFNIKEATIPDYEVAETEPLPKNVTQNNERIFSNIAKIFSKSKSSNKNKPDEETKFSKTTKDPSVNKIKNIEFKAISNRNSYKGTVKVKATELKPNGNSKSVLPLIVEKSALPIRQLGTITNEGQEKLKDTTSDRITKFEKAWKQSFEGSINKSIIANFFWYTLCVFKEGEEKKKLEEKFIEAAEYQKSKEKSSDNLRSRDLLSDKLDKNKIETTKRAAEKRYSLKDKESMFELQRTQSKLLDNIAGNYIELTLQIDLKFRDKFFETYYDCLAQAVFYCYFFAYPQSRNDILSEEFMNFLFRIISEQITGMPICNRGFESWSFDLGAGNILGKGKIKKSTLPTLAGISEAAQKNNHLLHMRYSPLVNRFMKNRKYEGYNVVNDWKMRYTLRNPKQRDIDSKMKEYTGLAVETVKNTKERFAMYEGESKKIDEEISKNKAYIQKVTALMESRTQAILKHNSREYANLLVSLRGEWPTYEND